MIKEKNYDFLPNNSMNKYKSRILASATPLIHLYIAGALQSCSPGVFPRCMFACILMVQVRGLKRKHGICINIARRHGNTSNPHVVELMPDEIPGEHLNRDPVLCAIVLCVFANSRAHTYRFLVHYMRGSMDNFLS